MRLDGTSSHALWKGDAASYGAMHRRVARTRGTPKKCERCGRDDPSQRYEWANLTGDLGNPLDYERMCVPCHRRFDYRRPGDRAVRSDNKTGVAGVEHRPDLWPKNPWRASIKSNGRVRYLGLFGTREEAVAARRAAEMELASCG